MFVVKSILMRFKLYGQQSERQKIQDLQDTVKDVNDRLKVIETALNSLQAQIDAL